MFLVNTETPFNIKQKCDAKSRENTSYVNKNCCNNEI